MNHPRSLLGPVWPAVLLAALAFAVYWQVAGHQYVNFDDVDYIVHNVLVRRGLTWAGLASAFSMDSAFSYWHPLTWLSLMAGTQWLGDAPAAVLLVNTALHWATACLLWLFLEKATGERFPSLLAGAFFVLHPMNVESVAWAVERKTVLMGVFSMCVLHAHLWWSRRPGPYPALATAGAMAAALMSKVAAMVLPFMLLVADVWPLRRRQGAEPVAWRRLALEKAPLACLAVAAVLISIASRHDITVATELGRPMGLRLANALVSVVRYISKAVWPQDLSVYYPYPHAVPAWQWGGALFLVTVVTALLFRIRKDKPYLLTGWLWFLVGLAPTSGLVQAGLWPAMADRFAYLSLMGLCWMASFGIADLVGSRARWLLAGLVCAYLALFAWAQVGVWHDGVSLFVHARTLYPDDPVINQQLGNALYRQGRFEEAGRAFGKATELKPDYKPAWKMLGLTRQRMGDTKGAEKALRHALAIDPGYAEGLMALGNLIRERGDPSKALPMLRRAVELDPAFAPAYFNLGLSRYESGDFVGAERSLRKALELRPGETAVLIALGRVLEAQGRHEAAADALQTALADQPGNAEGHLVLAGILDALGQSGKARAHRDTGLRIQHQDAEAFADLGDELVALGRRGDATAAYARALDLEPGLEQARKGLATVGPGK